MTSTTPTATSCQYGLTLMMMNPFWSTAGMNTPMTVPMIVATPPKRLRAAERDRGDRLEVVRGVAADRRGREVRQGDEPGEAAGEATDDVDLEQVPLDVEADAARRLLARADGQGVPPEHGQMHPDVPTTMTPILR